MTDLIDKTLIPPIELMDAHGVWIFDPQPDITAYEAALLGQLWTKIILSAWKGSRIDWREYMAANSGHLEYNRSGTTMIPLVCDLARHFRKEDIR